MDLQSSTDWKRTDKEEDWNEGFHCCDERRYRVEEEFSSFSFSPPSLHAHVEMPYRQNGGGRTRAGDQRDLVLEYKPGATGPEKKLGQGTGLTQRPSSPELQNLPFCSRQGTSMLTVSSHHARPAACGTRRWNGSDAQCRRARQAGSSSDPFLD